MQTYIRKALQTDCAAIMDLVNELAVYEKEPNAVTVTMEHFVESGFGENPVWQAFVVEQPPLTSTNEVNYLSGDFKEYLSEEKIGNQSPLLSPTFLPPLEGIGEAVIFGFALYYTRYSTWKGQRMYLEDFYVTEKMRGCGAGKLLFDKLIAECKEKKYSGLVWQVLDWNEPAINFYKKYDGVNFDAGWLNCSMEF